MLRACELDLRTIAFPAIRCGVFGFPAQLACKTAMETILEALGHHPGLERVRLLFGDAMYEATTQAKQEALESGETS